ncbi:DUF222 domain-containing protein [Gordonia sp. X0973]|uniref:DUF222 domain-containing protein n=1 Tax=Gordonia sp. X0973 TaxID=2742602 RepID=UPI000F523A68|nr:DUF222 domain-containing protein [Gordonia sp. X0973]QKT06101.1 DUF222 domain-containing protein [Gordonia sp. X0973]
MTVEPALPDEPLLPQSPTDLIATIRAAVDKLATAVWAAETEDELLAAARSLEAVRCAQEGVDAQLFTEINDRCAYARDGFTHPMTWLAKGLRLGRSEAKKRYRRAEKIARLTGMTGETRAPEFPATAAAVAEGVVSGAHVDEIRAVIRRIPAKLPVEVVEQAERDLAAMAADLTPQELRKAGICLLTYLDPDGALCDERDRKRQRTITIGSQDQQLMSRLLGNLTPTLRAKIELIFAGMAAPGMNNRDDDEQQRLFGSIDELGSDDASQARLADARQRDRRSPEQRAHDALEAMCDYVIGHEGLGRPNRIATQLVFTAPLADIVKRAGTALSTTGTLVPVRDLVELAARADQSLVVFQNHTTEVLYHGRSKRKATFGQRLAIFARDRGGTAPDDDTPFIFTEAHHLPDWAKGGRTDVDKLAAASGRHNRRVGDGPGQWETTFRRHGPQAGRVEWRLRDGRGELGRPRINDSHHPQDLAHQSIRRLRARFTEGDPTRPNRNRVNSTPVKPVPSETSGVEARLCTRLGYAIL